MPSHLIVQIHHGVHDRGQRLVDMHHVAAIRLCNPGRDLPGDGIGDERAAGFLPQSQRMLGDDAPCIGVVGGHGHVAGEQQLLVDEADLPQLPQPTPDALTKLVRRLARERQAEHLLGSYEPVGDQPHDSSRHRLGLAGAGSGNHDARRVPRSLDDGSLLIRRGATWGDGGGDGTGREPRRSAGRRDRRGSHRHCDTCRPSGCTGHDDRTGQNPQ